DEPAPHIPENLATEDKWILSQFNSLVKAVTNSLENYELGIAVQNLYDFIWDVFCDWYIEIAKIRLNGDNEEGKKTAKAVLVYVMSNTLKLLHPFMPFITEEIWLALPHDGESIMISEWCKYDEALNFSVEEEAMERVMTAIKAVRNRRAEMNVPPSKKAKLYIATKYTEDFTNGSVFMNRLASASEVEIGDEFEIEGSVSVITESAKIYIPLNELVDFEAEKARLQKELDAAKKDLEFVENKLNNPGFMAKAPEKVVAQQRDAQEKHKAKIAMLEESLLKLK
ncbi:MAG: class I tRNA ligase family protein, partial [Acutalibacteraceae bacterium]|nr:class I tRNA ligase family protein [Acutalibacteraceae bacterium]